MQKVFIGSIKSKRRPKEIQDILLDSNMVLKAKKLYPKKGKIKKGFAIFDVLLKKHIPMQKFLSKKFELDGEELFLTEYLSENEVQKRNFELRFRKLHISNIPDHMTEQAFRKMFEVYGEIETAYLSRDRYEKKIKQMLSQGLNPSLTLFGFVTFKDTASAENCYKNGNEELGVDFEITKFIPKSRNAQLDSEEGNREEGAISNGEVVSPTTGGKGDIAGHNYGVKAHSGDRTNSDSNSRQKGNRKGLGKDTRTHQNCRKHNAVDLKLNITHQRGMTGHRQFGPNRGQLVHNNYVEGKKFQKRQTEPFVFDHSLKKSTSLKIDICFWNRSHQGRNIRYNFKYPNARRRRF